MPPTLARTASIALLILSVALSVTLGAQSSITPDLTVHEWGTFTSVAASDGKTAQWEPLNGSVELPDFVEHRVTPKGSLSGTVRMETPVLYFYSPREMQVSVKVAFSKGVMTEWYPQASHVEPDQKRVLINDALYQRHSSGTIAWDAVTISPNLAPSFPQGKENGGGEIQGSQYYAARETAAAPLVVRTGAGSSSLSSSNTGSMSFDQQEKFLFYRGVSTISVPIAATVTSAGEVHLTNLGRNEIPSVILFQRRGEKVGYRLGGALPSEMSLGAPEMTGTVDALGRDFADILMQQGLNPDEARAMIATWRDSWFEEGSRLFYIVPENFVNRILPLTIRPIPLQTVRVFVGRVELITPETISEMRKILAAHDFSGLHQHERFLAPILDQMKEANPADAAQIDRDLDLTYQAIRPQQ